jgi:hypothetical protein
VPAKAPTGCSVDGCERPHKAFGWCGTHYTRWRRTGEGEPTKIRMRPECSIEGCDKPHFGCGWCQMHYQRWSNHGDPLKVSKHIGDPVANAEMKISRNGAGGCWPWTGARNSSGYGVIRIDDKTQQAHRVTYERFVGPIPDGMELDHLCRVRHCVNPAHLEPVTRHENWRRGEAPSAVNARKTHCDSGHEFTPENTYVKPRGGRECRTCMSERRRRAYRARKREKVSA